MVVNTKFYDGFEGEPQITFCLLEEDVITEKVSIWDGYFNEIMKMIQPEKEGWTGLAYYYHLYSGWYEEDEWFIPNILDAYEQLASINIAEVKYEEEKEILFLVTKHIKKAIDHGGRVYIIYD